jgi:uncharacterized membrane protein YfcA
MDARLSVGLALGGFVLGAFGTLIGAGGGFLLLPVLILLYPADPPAVLTAISLAVVCANAVSGSIAYASMRRIDVRAGVVFALAGMPGAILGARATALFDRHVFDPMLGVALVLAAGFLLLRSGRSDDRGIGGATRTLIESDGTIHRYAPRMGLGVAISFAVGFVSSLLGIGGGVLHVPAMASLLGFPIHVATATSHFVLALLALAGVIVHLADGSLAPGLTRILPTAAGVLAGAQIGARLSARIHGRWIVRSLALALALVGIRLILIR